MAARYPRMWWQIQGNVLRFTSNPGGNRAGFTAAWSFFLQRQHCSLTTNSMFATGRPRVAGDSVGSYDGAVSGAVSRDSTATSGIKPDTCSSALMAGGAIDINGLPVNTTSGAKTSVSLLMYWSGANSGCRSVGVANDLSAGERFLRL